LSPPRVVGVPTPVGSGIGGVVPVPSPMSLAAASNYPSDVVIHVHSLGRVERPHAMLIPVRDDELAAASTTAQADGNNVDTTALDIITP
jgi:hypothetical protein